MKTNKFAFYLRRVLCVAWYGLWWIPALIECWVENLRDGVYHISDIFQDGFLAIEEVYGEVNKIILNKEK